MTDQIIKHTLFHWLIVYITVSSWGKAKGGGGALKRWVVLFVGCILDFSVYGSTISFDAASLLYVINCGIVQYWIVFLYPLFC